jgi:hypothetical protein
MGLDHLQFRKTVKESSPEHGEWVRQVEVRVGLPEERWLGTA